jgi:hypothetical protein
MKKIISLITFALCVSAPSFAAVHVVSRYGEFVAKSVYHVTKPPVKAAAKGSEAAVKFVF